MFLYVGLLALASMTAQMPHLAAVFAAIGAPMPAVTRWLVEGHAIYVPHAVTMLLLVAALAVEWCVQDARRKAVINVAMAVVVFLLLAVSVLAFWTPLEAVLTRK